MKTTWHVTAVAAVMVWSFAACGCSDKSQPNDDGASSKPTQSPAASPTPGMPGSRPMAAGPGSANSASPQTPSVSTPPAAKVATSPEMDAMREQFGLEVTSVTNRGPMVEVRLLVSDPQKAGPIVVSTEGRFMINQETGIKITSPKMTHARLLPSKSGGAVVDRNTAAWFDNTTGLIKSGDKVTIILGEYRLTDLVVQ